jgi:hypothetical protein
MARQSLCRVGDCRGRIARPREPQEDPTPSTVGCWQPTMEREEIQTTQHDTAVADRVANILSAKATILAGANGPEGVDAADRFAAELTALARESPTQETRDVVDALLNANDLGRFADSAGVPCRVAVVKALLELGFPYALEVSPDDLLLVREHATQDKPGKGTNGLRVASSVSTLWYGLVLGLLSQVTFRLSWLALLLFLPVTFFAAHGLTGMITSLVAKPRARRQIYGALAWSGLLAVLGTGFFSLLGVGDSSYPLLGQLMLTAPAIVTSVFAALEAKRLGDRSA